jgi:NADH-quinone oxidoreductase subunit M
VISGALFLCVGVVYDRMHTREIAFYGGLTARMPWYAAVFMLFSLGNVGLPGTSGFVGEILSLVGVYRASTWTAILAATGVILSATYALTLYRRMMFDPLTNPKLETITDLEPRETAIFTPLIIGTVALGLAPSLVLNLTMASAAKYVALYQLLGGG